MIFASVDTMMDSDDDHHFELLPRDRNKCTLIADVIIIQCVCVCVGAATILSCVWTPEYSTWDFDKLTRIMYLYDSEACGYQLRKAKMISNLQISNETFGLEVLPIKWQPAITTVSTRLSAKTRNGYTPLPDQEWTSPGYNEKSINNSTGRGRHVLDSRSHGLLQYQGHRAMDGQLLDRQGQLLPRTRSLSQITAL
ncbi:unnamed protein product [Spodoptera littoralis]|uniref:Uncharacterized protein n=1 Tax=Spodoptera littoralis TaxID=7109 RepID=A0A9P0MZW5_SPOLI|nr:unnamed protein product [Spodoptera littoralis]CAH1636309.1 unnamed protein product [Spodoptera littoralis]